MSTAANDDRRSASRKIRKRVVEFPNVQSSRIPQEKALASAREGGLGPVRPCSKARSVRTSGSSRNHKQRVAVTVHQKQRVLPGVLDGLLEVRHVPDRLAVRFLDYVAFLQSR